jgi:hypothetical protein
MPAAASFSSLFLSCARPVFRIVADKDSVFPDVKMEKHIYCGGRKDPRQHEQHCGNCI